MFEGVNMIRAFFASLCICLFAQNLGAVPLKNLASVVGVRQNQLIGYGLVVGLNGSGDGTSSEFTLQSIANMLQGMNVKIDSADIKSKNTAAVMVTAQLPAFGRSGDLIDVTVSSMGDAKSIQGGTLLMTALKGVDGEIYAIAQGPVAIGGLSAKPGASGKHSTAASIINGATVERELPLNFARQNNLTLSLKAADFFSANNIEMALNGTFGEQVAKAVDSKTIKLKKPEGMSNVEFMARVMQTDVAWTPQSKVVINERTGTIIAGVNVEVEPIMISHKDITIKIDPNNNTPLTKNEVDMKDGGVLDPATNTLKLRGKNTTVANLARLLNKLGASPEDIISIMESLKFAGAINADLEVI